ILSPTFSTSSRGPAARNGRRQTVILKIRSTSARTGMSFDVPMGGGSGAGATLARWRAQPLNPAILAPRNILRFIEGRIITDDAIQDTCFEKLLAATSGLRYHPWHSRRIEETTLHVATA